MEGFVDGSKSWLFVVVENSPVPMENEDTFVLCFSAVAAIDAVVWTVVPLAVEHMEAFCDTRSNVSTAEPDEGSMNSDKFVSNLSVQHAIKTCSFTSIFTWVVVKYDVQKILVAPGDIEFILLEERHQNFLPTQQHCCHVILEEINNQTDLETVTQNV